MRSALRAITQVLEVGEREANQAYDKLIDEYNGVEYLESLQEHADDEVYQTALRIIERFFGDEDGEDENLAPATTASGTFAFGAPGFSSTPRKQLFQDDQAKSPKRYPLSNRA